MPAEKQVTEAVQQALQRLLAHPCSLLLAVSGGIDSMVLLHVLRRVCTDKRWSLAVCHVHHGLRGVEADRDARFVEQETRRLHIAYVSKRLDVLAEQARTGESQEAVARRLRYQALVEAAASLGASAIATAHHQQDQAETVLLRVLRGTSVSGLAGIQEFASVGGAAPIDQAAAASDKRGDRGFCSAGTDRLCGGQHECLGGVHA